MHYNAISDVIKETQIKHPNVEVENIVSESNKDNDKNNKTNNKTNNKENENKDNNSSNNGNNNSNNENEDNKAQLKQINENDNLKTTNKTLDIKTTDEKNNNQNEDIKNKTLPTENKTVKNEKLKQNTEQNLDKLQNNLQETKKTDTISAKRKVDEINKEISNNIFGSSADIDYKIKSSGLKKNLFIKFDIQKAIDFDYNNIKYTNFGFLENNDELKIIKKIIKEQQDPEIRRIHDENAKMKQNIQFSMMVKKPKKQLKVYNLIYFNENNWTATINNETLNNNNIRTKTIMGVKIVKINKLSIIFLMKNANNDVIKKIKSIKKNNSPYSENYYLIERNKKTYVAFKLFVGQKIDLETMEINY